MKRLLTIIILACAFTITEADEFDKRYNPVYTAMVSNTIAPDARAGGMGDIGAATDPDVASQYWNPAKYPFCISRAGVQVSYTPWLRKLVSDMNIANVSGYYRIGDYSAVSASLQYFSLGEVYTEYDEQSQTVGSNTIKPYEMSVDLAYSMMLSEKFSLAAGVRLLVSDVSYSTQTENKTATAFAADIACYYQNYVNIGDRECQLGLGLSLRNVGSKMNLDATSSRADFIPTNLRLGASLMIPINEYNRFSIAADANRLLVPSYPRQRDGESSDDFEKRRISEYYDVGSIEGIFKSFGDTDKGFQGELDKIQWSLGAEYSYNDRFMLRGGYHHESESLGNRKYFTVGAGFKMSAFTLDAAYVISTAQSNPLDQTMKFSLTFDLDGIKDLLGRR